MACPDKKKDARIIAEIERRKNVLENPEFIHEILILEGDLFFVANTVNEKEVINISKLDDNSWEIELFKSIKQ